MKKLPGFYNNLDLIKLEIFNLLSQGANDRKSEFHNLVLSTLDLTGRPTSRTVVLRNFEKKPFTLGFHSDSRSKKILEIVENNNVSLLFYDTKKKIQLRIFGHARILHSHLEAWKKLSNWSKRCYLSSDQPSIKSSSPTSGFPEKFSYVAPNENESNEGLVNFSYVSVQVKEIDWLYLASQGHRRAKFRIKQKDSEIFISSDWITP